MADKTNTQNREYSIVLPIAALERTLQEYATNNPAGCKVEEGCLIHRHSTKGRFGRETKPTKLLYFLEDSMHSTVRLHPDGGKIWLPDHLNGIGKEKFKGYEENRLGQATTWTFDLEGFYYKFFENPVTKQELKEYLGWDVISGELKFRETRGETKVRLSS